MKKFKFTIRGDEYDVQIKEIEDNIAIMEVNGTSYEVEIKSELKTTKTPTLVRKPVVQKPGEGLIQKSVSTGGLLIKAPLPGTIIKINVKEGDTVQKGQSLMVMEAMKMENQILSEKDGVITSVKVKEGEAVLQDDVLVEIG